MRMRDRKYLIAATAGVAAFLATSAGPIAQAAANPGPDSAGISVLSAPGPERQAPSGAVIYQEQGTRTPTGTCKFKTEGKRDASKPPAVLYFTELSYDPATCSRTMARAEYAPDKVPQAIASRFARDNPGQERTESGEKAPASRPNTGSSQLTVIPFYVQAQAWWEDPVFIDLTLTRSTVSGAFVLEDLGLYGPTYHQSYWGWFDTSGWQLDSTNHQFHKDFYNALTNTIGTFSNPSFYLPFICDEIGAVTYSGHPLTLVYYSYGFVGWCMYLEKDGNCKGGMSENYAVWIA